MVVFWCLNSLNVQTSPIHTFEHVWNGQSTWHTNVDSIITKATCPHWNTPLKLHTFVITRNHSNCID